MLVLAMSSSYIERHEWVYDPRFYDSRFPFYDMQQQQQMLLPFVFNASTLPAVPQNSQQPEGASGTQSSLPSTPSPETSSLSSVKEDNGDKKRRPKWTH